MERDEMYSGVLNLQCPPFGVKLGQVESILLFSLNIIKIEMKEK